MFWEIFGARGAAGPRGRFGHEPPCARPSGGWSGAWLFYLLALLAVALLALGLWEKISLWRQGRLAVPVACHQHPLGAILADVLLGRRIWRGDRVAGLMHLMLLWGFLGLFLGTCAVAVDHYLTPFLRGGTYLWFSAGLEVCGLLLVLGLVIALVRRWLMPVTRLERRPDDTLLPLWLLAVACGGFMVEAARLAATAPPWATWSFVGNGLAHLFASPAVARALYPWLWWSHAVISLGFIAWLCPGPSWPTPSPLRPASTCRASPWPCWPWPPRRRSWPPWASGTFCTWTPAPAAAAAFRCAPRPGPASPFRPGTCCAGHAARPA